MAAAAGQDHQKNGPGLAPHLTTHLANKAGWPLKEQAHDAIGVDVNIKIDWGNLRHALHHMDLETVGRDVVLEWHSHGKQRIMLHAMLTTMY